jgi:hypothetical protein
MGIVNRITPTGGPFQKPEYLIMQGGPSALFADKVLIMEGPQDVIVSSHLDRLAAKYAAVCRDPHVSFAMNGWCVFHATKADQIMNCINIFNAIGKKTVAVLDGDSAGRNYAEQVKDSCPTFVYHSLNYKDPALEEALLAGLPPDDEQRIRAEFKFNCLSFSRMTLACWKIKGACTDGKDDDISDRKNRLQNLCLKAYEKKNLFPPVFRRLLEQIDSDSAIPGKVHELNVDR